MYIRVTRTVQDRGALVRPEDLDKTIIDREVDWYYSAFIFGEDAKEYWDANGESIKGYNGEVFTKTLYWDLDCKPDFEKARKAAIDLHAYLDSLGLSDSVEIYFSGNKGFHILLATTGKFNNVETSAICYNVAKEAGVPMTTPTTPGVFDTSVYNVTRIFRVPNTRHQESGLYKIPLTLEELQNASTDEIREMAKDPRFEEFDTVPANVESFREKYCKLVQIDNPPPKSPPGASPTDESVSTTFEGLDMAKCPPGQRRCVYVLEQGYYGAGERHAAILRLAAYYRGQGFSRKHAGNLIFESLNRRVEAYGVSFEEAECNRDIDQIYSKDWKGGTFTCKSDIFLQSKCDHGHGPCYNDAKVLIRNVISANQLINKYISYGEEALVEYPKFGLPWLDDKVRLRPKTFSMIAGANGSGKTSLAFGLMEDLNNKGIFHVLFSLDMSDPAIFEKLGAKYTSYTQRQIESAFNVNTANSEIVQEVMDRIRENLPYTLFDFSSAVNMEYIEQTIMGLKQVYESLQVAIIDYAGKLIGEFDNQYANSTASANKANDVAKRTSTHLLFLSQVSRENGDHTDPLRSSRVSKDSGAWEENATSVITMWRPFGSGLNGGDDYVHIYVGKNRSGPLGENVFHWHGKTGDIRELESQHDFEHYRILCQQHNVEEPRFNPFIEDSGETNEIKAGFKERAAVAAQVVVPKIYIKAVQNESVKEKVSDIKPARFIIPKRPIG